MSVKEFLDDRFWSLIFHIISMISLAAFLYLTGTTKGIIFIILIVWIISISIWLFIDFVKLNAHFKELQDIFNGLDQKYLFAECIEKPKSLYERHIFSLIKRSGKSMLEEVSNAQYKQKEYQEYIENWVHEIKVPITSSQLICQNNKSELTRKIIPNLTQIEEHVERVLYYGRAGSVEKDFIIKKELISHIVTETISKYKPLLIQNNIQINTSNLDTLIYTDGKWVSFMIGQLLSNAVRYRKEKPVISIEVINFEDKAKLNIIDNGIGIPSHELSRIFERGFTGTSGRKRGGSTGMGLYICKQLAEFLHIELKAESVENEFTKISMIFPSKENLTNM